MPTAAAIQRELTALRAAVGPRPQGQAAGLLAELKADPSRILGRAGLTPDLWQTRLLRSASSRVLMCCTRQAGKTTEAAALALGTALLEPRADVLLVSATLRQAAESFRRVMDLYSALGRPVAAAAESVLRVELVNGARVQSLPCVEANVRGFSPRMAVVDEAARVPDPVYHALRPALAVTRGRLIALSTAFGKSGWFYESWVNPGPWEKVMVTADDCPRIGRAFLEEERAALGGRVFLREYYCEFCEADDAVFSEADIRAALRADVVPLFA